MAKHNSNFNSNFNFNSNLKNFSFYGQTPTTKYPGSKRNLENKLVQIL